MAAASPSLPVRTSRDTAEIPLEEILHRLELGRLEFEETEGGTRLAVRPEVERRNQPAAWSGTERRSGGTILQLPTRFPDKGPILCLLVGGWADDRALREPLPFWGDDEGRSYMLWQALQGAGLLHRGDGAFALGRGGFWDEDRPRTQGLALTYAGFKRRGQPVDFEAVIRPWNLRRLQRLVEACQDRSMGRLRIITLGEVARFMMCAVTYGMAGIPILSIPSPAEVPDQAEEWIDYATDLLAAAR